MFSTLDSIHVYTYGTTICTCMVRIIVLYNYSWYCLLINHAQVICVCYSGTYNNYLLQHSPNFTEQ